MSVFNMVVKIGSRGDFKKEVTLEIPSDYRYEDIVDAALDTFEDVVLEECEFVLYDEDGSEFVI